MRPVFKSYGNEYCECVLLYDDDNLVVSENDDSILKNEIRTYFERKEESVRPPKTHLDSFVRKVELETGDEVWAFNSSQHANASS